ncbi:MAG: hypothetical protein H7X95_04435 [Deltaproteobacteria bacterium]|nr:hypothetical protein [Deltaproteobacteria bacterium]
MKRSSLTPTVGSIFALFALTCGCAPNTKVPAGAPLLVQFAVVTPAGVAADLVTEGGAPIAAPPLSYFFALFDRILDPTALENLDADGGLTSKAGVASIEWSGPDAIAANTLYIPNGDQKFTLIPKLFGAPFGIGPSITVMPSFQLPSDEAVMALPSGTTITVTLDPTKVRSHDQLSTFKAAPGVPSPLVFETEPFGFTTDAPVGEFPEAGVADDGGADGGDTGDAGPTRGPPPPVAADFVLHVAFNNLTTDATGAAIQVAATVGGIPVAGLVPVVARDPMSLATWTVSPPAAGWPAGALVTVTVGAAAADVFQIALGAAVPVTFTVMP